MKITIEWLEAEKACALGKKWFLAQKETDSVKLVKILAKKNYDWANWLIVRLMTHQEKIQYAVFAAEQELTVYEEKYPSDKQPRHAIEAAKNWIKNPNEKNRQAVDAAYASYADTAYAADVVAANDAAYNAAYNAANAAYAAYATLKTKIIKFGLKVIKNEHRRVK
jgi:hypothetical protein